MSSVLYYILNGVSWPWRQRWPEIQEGMSEERTGALFDRTDARHSAIMKEPHLCECYAYPLHFHSTLAMLGTLLIAS